MVQTTNIQLSGLTCGSCEKVISKRLQKIEGVQEVQVSSQNGETLITAARHNKADEVTFVLEGTHDKIINNL